MKRQTGLFFRRSTVIALALMSLVSLSPAARAEGIPSTWSAKAPASANAPHATAPEKVRVASDTPKSGDGASRGFYLGGSVGGVFPGGLLNQSFTVAPVGFTASGNQGFSMGTGFSGAAQAGYQFDSARVEGEYLYQSLGRSNTTFTVTPTTAAAVSTTYPASGTSVSTNSLFVNGYYDFSSKSRWSPYVGGGLGITWLSASSYTTGNTILRTPGLNQSAFAYQAKVGLSYQVSDWTSMFFQYRYGGTAGFKYGGATVTAGTQTFVIPPTSGGLSNHTLELGVRIRP